MEATVTHDGVKPAIGFIGLGRMGAPMAARVLAAGYEWSFSTPRGAGDTRGGDGGHNRRPVRGTSRTAPKSC